MRVLILLIGVVLLMLASGSSQAQQRVVIPLGSDGELPVRKEIERGDTISQSTLSTKILQPQQISGSIQSPGDVDYYQLIFPYCQRITVETEAVGGDTCGNGGAIDSLVSILSSGGSSTLASNDDISSANSCSRAQAVTASHAGVFGYYYIKVEASPDCSQCTFNYKFTLSEQQWLC